MTANTPPADKTSGKISIHAENILPIIKKWLYSEKDIFLRELVANAIDALHKLHKINTLGEETRPLEDFVVRISIDQDAGTISIADTGIGMETAEIEKYINQVAFSGLHDFVEKYQDKGADQQVIGHFGLGFYSSFMVADKVEIDSLSYRPMSAPAHWVCDGSINYTLSASNRTAVGTTITLHVSDNSKEMLSEATLTTILQKYCAFVKYPVFIHDKQVNDPRPLWTKSASQLSDKDYLDFFHRLFPSKPDPLFWIHLNVDYPFNLRGIMYFPSLRHELDASQGEVKLYCNQVYVADNLKEVVPDYLTVLQGALDCPDLPLNVSRSYLQNDPQVRKISQHIAKKVADKLLGMAKTEADKFQNCWQDVHPFIKYAMMRDSSTYEKLQPYVLYKSTKGDYLSLDKYIEQYGEKTDNTIIYCSDIDTQAAYVAMFEEAGIAVLVADKLIDTHFMQYLEAHTQGQQGDKSYKFRRIDADVSKSLVQDNSSVIVDPKDNKNASDKIADLFRNSLTRQQVKIEVKDLKSTKVPAMLVFDENTRRLQEMSNFGRDGSNQPLGQHTLVVNQSNGAIRRLLTLAAHSSKTNEIALMVNQIYDLAYLQHSRLSSSMMRDFIERSASLLEKVGSSGSTSIILE